MSMPRSSAPSWSTGLLECLDDPRQAVMCLLCPHYVIARNKALVDSRSTSLCDLVCCPSEYSTRQQLRARYGLRPSPLRDAILCVFCCPLMVCQHSRELNIRYANEIDPRVM
eukprot:PhM_4_TR5455/c0_g1_i1/m.21802